jgi:hypothetical protein
MALLKCKRDARSGVLSTDNTTLKVSLSLVTLDYGGRTSFLFGRFFWFIQVLFPILLRISCLHSQDRASCRRLVDVLYISMVMIMMNGHFVRYHITPLSPTALNVILWSSTQFLNTLRNPD